MGATSKLMVRLAILYGSETGNAKEYADILLHKLLRYNYHPICVPLDDFNPKDLLSIDVLCVLCSTTGQGEMPKNAKKMWKFLLRKKLPSDLFDHMVFTTFGLGDSSYPKFNFAIKKIHQRLLQLGASEFTKRAEADEQNSEGTDGFYREWEKELIAQLVDQFKMGDPIPEDEILPPRSVITLGEKSNEIGALRHGDDEVQLGKVTLNKRITADDHFQDVRQFVVECGNIEYQPGDTIGLYPHNECHNVETLIKCQGWEDLADRIIKGIDSNIDGGLVENLTLRQLITHHLDIMSIPRRSFFMTVWHFSSNEQEREKLKEFGYDPDPEELYNYANRPRRSILETLVEFDSVRIPIEYILEVFPLIRPRLFSISSSTKQSPTGFELTVAIVKYQTMLRRIRRGLCTNWLQNLKSGDSVYFKLHRNGLTVDQSKPVLMIAPGTGVAPMKALILENEGREVDQVLFFGNRYHDKDFLHEQVLTNSNVKLFTAFSREHQGYVQDTLFMEAALVYKMIVEQECTVYVCGSSGKMPIQVRMTLQKVLEDCGKMSEQDAHKYLLDIENTRYLQETW